ncbi:MAG: hypothetical protein RhofKO_23250 [Rhodothermales bacterium]
MHRLLVLVVLTLFGCQPPVPSSTTDSAPAEPSVYAVDLVRTFPGAQGAYLRSIEANWANARRLVQAQGEVLSYQAFVLRTDSSAAWDVMLMTEYRDSSAFANREATFQAVFNSPEFVAVPAELPRNEMRTFFASELTLHAFVSSTPTP